MRIAFYFLILIITAAAHAENWANDMADDAINHLKRCGSGIVTSVETGDKLTLDGGTRVVLAGIRAPSYLYKDTVFDPARSWPFSKQSKDYLSKISLGKSITLHCQGTGKARNIDRHGRTIAHAMLSGKSINQSMIKYGWAFAYPYKTQNSVAQRYYNGEDHARAAKRGIWRDTTYQPLSADRPKDIPIGKFVIIKGTVKKHGKARQDHYLNFGDDWKSDFTIKLSKTSVKHIEKRLGFPLKALEGKQIEVRGWSEYGGGPMIDLVHTARLRLITTAVNKGQ